MPKIQDRLDYDGAPRRLERLGLLPLWRELEKILTQFPLQVKEERDANGGAAVRELIDARFAAVKGWKKGGAGDVDWVKHVARDGAKVGLGVEIQMSARSDLLIIDVAHLRDSINAGDIDVGVIVVPSDRLGLFLTDRAAKYADALVAVERARARDDTPLVVLGLEHDGPGASLAKKHKK